MWGNQEANPIYSLPSAGFGVGTNPVETRIASASSYLSSDCIFLSIVRPEGPDRARIHFERPSDMEGENKNNVLAEAKQSIFNSRPQRKINELLSMATSRFCHFCCLHSLLLPFLFSLSFPSVPTVLAQVLPTLLSLRPAFAGNHFAARVLQIIDVPPLQQHLLCLACAHGIQIFNSKRCCLGPSKPPVF